MLFSFNFQTSQYRLYRRNIFLCTESAIFSSCLILLLSIGLSSCGLKRKKIYIPSIETDSSYNRDLSYDSGDIYTPLRYTEKPEMRAVWLTTIYALDWPRTRGTSDIAVKKQKEEFIQILTELKNANFNTIFLQVRLRGDLLYPSKLEPQSDILTGSTVTMSSYDPLAFAITECHKRGIALHAWMVTYPLGNQVQLNKLGKRGIASQHPEWVIAHNREYYLNPGIPEVRHYLSSIVTDLVARYDLDGVHFDYVRYPENASSFRDEYTYRRYRLSGQSKAEWREENITLFLEEVHRKVASIRPYTLISTAPIGRYRDIPGESQYGWTAKASVHQDPREWFKRNAIDFIVPMMYYKDELFDPFLTDWKEQMNGGIVIPGLGAYRTQDRSHWSIETIQHQLELIRKENLAGVCFYRQENISSKKGGLYNLINKYFEFPVRPLPFNNRVAPIPGMPFFDRCEIVGDELILTWKPRGKMEGNTSYNLFFNLYSKAGNPCEDYLLAASISTTNYRIPLSIFPKKGKIHFRVEAANRLNQVGQASKPLIIDLKHHLFLLP